jgi:NodT family efflux transporter outer membrane factor (OMF) lipoprotein
LSRVAHRRIAGAALGLFALSGCAVGPHYKTPKSDVPGEFAASSANGVGDASPAPDLAAWWRSLRDEELNSLVERAVKSNFDIEVALTRLQQARTYEVVVAGHALPEADASGSAARGTGTDLSRGRAQQALVSADNSAGLQHINTIAGFDTVWELDFFGKYRRQFEAARALALASRAARSAVISSVIADVVRAYVDLRGLQTRAAVLKKAQAALAESLRIVNIRYERGITNELDAMLARREYNALSARLEPLNAAVNAAKYSIAVLIGEYPETLAKELDTADVVPSAPSALPASIPLDLLKRRPDIHEAERELAAATARIGVATANLFPQVAVVAAIGSQSQGWGATPNIAKHIWSFGPAAAWPLLDFGALDAQVDIADLEAHARLVNYRKTIVGAVQEVDTALDGFRAGEQQLKSLEEAMLAAQRAVELASERYDRGLTDYLNVVDAERQLYDLQDQYIVAQVSGDEQFVQLYKSLGGGWQNYQTVPGIRTPQPAVIAMFRRTLTGKK